MRHRSPSIGSALRPCVPLTKHFSVPIFEWLVQHNHCGYLFVLKGALNDSTWAAYHSGCPIDRAH